MYWLRSSVGSDLLSLTANRSRSVLAVKGSLRAAPWTAAGRSEGMTVYEGKGGMQIADFVSHRSIAKSDHFRVDEPHRILSAIPAALTAADCHPQGRSAYRIIASGLIAAGGGYPERSSPVGLFGWV